MAPRHQPSAEPRFTSQHPAGALDSPTAIEDGRLNLLDVYVFPEAPGTSTLVVGVNPDAGRSSPTTFLADALYEFVIASDGGTDEDRAFRMSFSEPDADGP
jgi:Domain of unknown function (DUF4331)